MNERVFLKNQIIKIRKEMKKCLNHQSYKEYELLYRLYKIVKEDYDKCIMSSGGCVRNVSISIPPLEYKSSDAIISAMEKNRLISTVESMGY